jgi:hypothetical protein
MTTMKTAMHSIKFYRKQYIKVASGGVYRASEESPEKAGAKFPGIGKEDPGEEAASGSCFRHW